MLMNIAIFILFLAPLIFFHELGHFLFARLFGVKVEVFSIGFGPKIIKVKYGETEYALSIIPLGGYVKMFGDDPQKMEEITEVERSRSFLHQSKWARFWIVFGGPLANFLLAIFLFFVLAFVGEKVPEIKFGLFPQDSIFDKSGIAPGDILKKVNNVEIVSPTDYPIEKFKTVNSIEVGRAGKNHLIPIEMPIEDLFKEIYNYPPFIRTPVVVHHSGKKVALSLSKGGVDWSYSLDHFASAITPIDIYFFEVKGESNDKGEYEVASADPSLIRFVPNGWKSFHETLSKAGYYSLDLVVKSVSMKSAADEAGIKGGDVILSLNQKRTYSFEDLRAFLQTGEGDSVKLRILRDQKEMDLSLRPEVLDREGKKVKIIGVYSGGEFQAPTYVKTEGKSFFDSLLLGVTRSWQSGEKVLSGLKKLVTSEISFKMVGGPLSIGKVATDSFNTSLSYFFQIMALISVNLGLINLFPIPVLDGGHILFILLEFFNRGPLSRKKMEVAQQIGLSFLLILMAAALFNDFTRFF